MNIINSNRLIAAIAVSAIALQGLVAPASAATASGTVAVSATLTSICAVNASTMPFGNITATTPTPLTNAGGNVNVTCSNTTAYTVALDKGANGATIALRKMNAGANFLSYQLYTDAAHTIIFGDGTTGVTVAGTGNGVSQAIPIFGQVPAQAGIVPGVYADTVNVTLTY